MSTVTLAFSVSGLPDITASIEVTAAGMTDTRISALPAGAATNLTPVAVVPATDAAGNTVKFTAAQLKAQIGDARQFPISLYGALEDGLTDDAAAIQAAIDAAYAAGGGVVMVANTALIKTGLVGRASVHLAAHTKGELRNPGETNPGTYKHGARILCGAAMPAMYTFTGNAAPEMANIGLQNLLFECASVAAVGVFIRNATDVFLDNVQVHTATASPFIIGTAADTANAVSWVYLRRCYANGSGGASVLYTLCGTQIRLTECLSDDGATAVSVVGGSANVQIISGRFENATVKNIAFGDFSHSLSVEGTTLLIGAANGIGIDFGDSQGLGNQATDVEIQGNGFAGTVGVSLGNAGAYSAVAGCRINNVATGIASVTAYGASISRNIVKVITGGTALSMSSVCVEHAVSDNTFGIFPGATGTTAITNASSSLTNTFLGNHTTGTVTGRIVSSPTLSMGADRGDTSQTLTVGTDHTMQFWATTLTANRTITLSTTNAARNDVFSIIRTGLGAFTLAVGALKTIPSATAARVDVMFDGSAWKLVGYQTL